MFLRTLAQLPVKAEKYLTEAFSVINGNFKSIKDVAKALTDRVNTLEAASSAATGASAEPSDGDKGDITVSGSGLVWTIDNPAPTLIVLSSDQTNNNAVANTLEDLTEFTFAVVSGQTYWFSAFIPFTSAASTTGSRWTINGPTTSFLTYRAVYPQSATSSIQSYRSAYSLPSTSSGSSVASGASAVIEGVITPSADGNVVVRFASEVAGSAITAKAGAILRYQRTA